MNPRFSLALVALILIGGALALYWSGRDQTVTVPQPPSIDSPAPAQSYVLAISWHPAFCESKSSLPECRNQQSSDFEARNLTLHGLWPDAQYCDVDSRLVTIAEQSRWEDLPTVPLTNRTRADLAIAMPGVEDSLDRYQWLKHGTCSGASPDLYYSRAITLLAAINNSAVGDLLSRNIGRQVSRNQVRAAFDAAFGDGAGRKVRVDCDEDGNRMLISELRINLDGDAMGSASFADLVHAARNAGNGCNGGLIDPVGRQ